MIIPLKENRTKTIKYRLCNVNVKKMFANTQTFGKIPTLELNLTSEVNESTN